MMLSFDEQRCCLKVGPLGCRGTAEELPCSPSKLPRSEVTCISKVPAQGHAASLKTAAGPRVWSTELRTLRDYVVQPGEQGKGLLLGLGAHHPDAKTSLEVRFEDSFTARYPDLDHVDCLHSAYNKNTFVHVTHQDPQGNTVVIPKGTHVATAYERVQLTAAVLQQDGHVVIH